MEIKQVRYFWEMIQTGSFSQATEKFSVSQSALSASIKREKIQADPHLASIDYRISRCPKSLPKVSHRAIGRERYIEKRKSSVRCKVEHAFRIIKRQFGFQKVPYQGLAKNENRLHALFIFAKLYVPGLAGQSPCGT